MGDLPESLFVFCDNSSDYWKNKLVWYKKS